MARMARIGKDRVGCFERAFGGKGGLKSIWNDLDRCFEASER